MYCIVLFNKETGRHSFFVGYDPNGKINLRWSKDRREALRFTERRAFELLRYIRLNIDLNDYSAFVCEIS